MLATNNLQLAAYGNVISNLFLFFLIYTCFKVQLIATDKFLKNNVNSLNIILLVIAIISIGFQLIYLNIPTISVLGIIWNLNSITSILLTLTTFIYGIYWGVIFGEIASILRDPFLKRRMYMVSTNGILLGISGLFLFQNNVNYSILGISLLFLTGIASSIVFSIPEHSKKSTKNDLASI
ncbi:MAG: hypothetical protein WCV55_02360 [Candidatus Paceibacterota bacterium]